MNEHTLFNANSRSKNQLTGSSLLLTLFFSMLGSSSAAEGSNEGIKNESSDGIILIMFAIVLIVTLVFDNPAWRNRGDREGYVNYDFPKNFNTF